MAQQKKKSIDATRAERFKAVFGRYPKGYTPQKAATASETLRERKAGIELGTQPLETAADTAFARSKGIIPKKVTDKDRKTRTYAEILREMTAKQKIEEFGSPAAIPQESFGGAAARLGGEVAGLTGDISRVKKGREVLTTGTGAETAVTPITTPLEQAAITGLETGATSKADTLRFNENLKRLGFKTFTEGIDTLKKAEERKTEFDTLVESILADVKPPQLITPVQAQQQAAQTLAQKYGKNISYIADIIGLINAIKQ